MSKVRIEVTLDDIARGERCKSTRCAIAMAAGRAFPDFVPGVSDEGLWLYRPGERSRERPAILPLPPEARAFVRAFDSGCAVAPFGFEVETQPC